MRDRPRNQSAARLADANAKQKEGNEQRSGLGLGSRLRRMDIVQWNFGLRCTYLLTYQLNWLLGAL